MKTKILLKIKNKIIKFLHHILFFLSGIPLEWDYWSKNFGDRLSPLLLSRITGKKYYSPFFKNTVRIFCIGSILNRADKNSLIWGSGFMSDKQFSKDRPKKIFAVRGPLTRKNFLLRNIECPKVYGDPAILLNKYFIIKKSKEYKYGIVPHFRDKKSIWVKRQLEKYKKEAVFIDIEADIEDVIKKICCCKFIISSSLHGLICADTYKIPNVRIILSNRVRGGNFKFDDYRLGLGEKYIKF